MAANFDETMEKLRALSDHLMPYNYPLGDPANEQDINLLKLAKVEADGYSIEVHFNKADYGEYILETVQIFGEHAPFLPFSLVVKLARKVLGSHHLSLVEFYQEERKIYCWSVATDFTGRPLPSPNLKKSKHCSYEGFEYIQVDAKELSFH